jgi:hypothetical protein
MNTYNEYRVIVTTAGSAGAASGTGTSEPINGAIESVTVDYGAAPATTTVDLDEVDGPARKILDLAAGNTDGTRYPRVQMQDNTGAALTGIYESFKLAGRKITVTVAAANDANIITVTIIAKIEEG